MRRLVTLIAFTVLLAFFAQPIHANEGYDFVVKFNSYKLPKSDGSWNTPVKTPSTLSFSKDGRACLAFGDKKYEFNFHTIELLTLKGQTSPDGFKISIDKDNFIMVMKVSDFALINMEKVCPYMNFLGWSNPEILSEVIKYIRRQQ